jgi:hypothetical protein
LFLSDLGLVYWGKSPGTLELLEKRKITGDRTTWKIYGAADKGEVY